MPLTLDTRHEAALAEFRAAGGTEDDLQVLREEEGRPPYQLDSRLSTGIQFVVISPNGDVETGQDLPTDPNERATQLSHLVHGDLEAIRLPEDAGLIGWVNDDGHELKLEHNPHAAKVLTALGAELGLSCVWPSGVDRHDEWF